eukprot:TRINITY_DN75702_c0_g1_i1.p1 TRINITY_DN75702_c0_g1~~TRINITY_DN75702_c0_g1_i1.p1  ORF type:complete len:100 (-),score=1.98 TRINITY_DN75702_c0_g1_i1:174-473(-)
MEQKDHWHLKQSFGSKYTKSKLSLSMHRFRNHFSASCEIPLLFINSANDQLQTAISIWSSIIDRPCILHLPRARKPAAFALNSIRLRLAINCATFAFRP